MLNEQSFCPECGVKAFYKLSLKEFKCAACGHNYFQNVAAATAAMIVVDGQLLFAKRGREPALGLYDFPGGFVDPDESLEVGLQRELREELAWVPTLEQINYQFSGVNTYLYAGVSYKIVDTFFLINLASKPQLTAQDDVAALAWLKLADIDERTLAFDSVRSAVKKLASRGLI